jgi:hypothetical protein
MLEKLTQRTTRKGTPLCIWCSKPIPNDYRRWYRLMGAARARYFHADSCAVKFAEWAAEQLYVAAEDKRLPPPVVP